MLRFEGNQEIRRPLPEVWSQLSDARFLVQCLPDVAAIQRVEPDGAELTIRPGLSFARGNLDTTVRLNRNNEQNGLQIDLVSKGIGSSSTVGISLGLAALETGTQAYWIAEIKELTGLLKLVPSGLIKGAAQKVIAEIWDRAVRKLEQGEAAAASP